MKFNNALLVIAQALTTSPILPLCAQSTAIVYQGSLNTGSQPANGSYDFHFTLYDAATNGNPVTPTVTDSAVTVSNGLFQTAIDFGAVFNGRDYFLALAVATNGATNFSSLFPLQAITPTPYALYASNAGTAGSVLAQNISGAIALGQLPSGLVTNGASGVNITGTFSGNGAGITNVNLLAAAPAGAIGVVTNYSGGNFTLASTVSVGPNPEFVTAADVNGDGKPDLISVSSSTNRLTVLTNNGAGGFVIAGIYSVGKPTSIGYGPSWVTVADVNGDGRPDLITANYGDHSVTVLLNIGNGTFATNATYGLGTNLNYAVAAADINGDGKIDLICSSGGTLGTLTILTNNGAGGFGTNAIYTVGNFAMGITTADINGDGKPDLICANEGANTLSVLTNNGSGGFVTGGTYTVGQYPYYAAAVDVNGDGKVDLVSVNWGGNSLTVLTNNGSGRFVTEETLSVGAAPWYVATADVNGDGKVDLITQSASDSNGTLTVLTNNGTGRFVTAGTYSAGYGPTCVAAADVNGDGAPDLITPVGSANGQTGSLVIFLNHPATGIIGYTPSFSGSFTGTFHGAATGDGSGLTNVSVNAANISGMLPMSQIPNLDAGKITSGTLAANLLPANVLTNNAAGVALTGTFGGVIAGNGAGLTNLTGSLNGYRMVHGQVTASGNVDFGTGDFSVVKNATGDFTITYSIAFNSYPTVTASSFAGNLAIPLIYTNSPAAVELQFFNPSGSLTDPNGFDFIANGPR